MHGGGGGYNGSGFTSARTSANGSRFNSHFSPPSSEGWSPLQRGGGGLGGAGFAPPTSGFGAPTTGGYGELKRTYNSGGTGYKTILCTRWQASGSCHLGDK